MDFGADNYRRFLAGDEDAMREIVAQYRAGLRAYLNGFVHDPDLADDLTQETFIKLCLKRPKDKGGGSFKTWLYTIGRHLALDALRKSGRSRCVPLDERFMQLEDPRTPEDDLLRSERQMRVRHAMALIAPPYRQILYLAYYEQFSIEAIAKILHKSRHNTSAQLYRAKAALKDALEKEDATDENK